MTGVFVPWNPRRTRGQSVRCGWITDASGCDIWTGTRNHAGYGIVKPKGKQRFVHRLRYLKEIGPIPEGYHLDHFVCDNGPGGCCNPHHCRPVTPRENILRGNSVSTFHAAKTHCMHGHPFSGKNLYITKDGVRQCRTCRNVRSMAYYYAKKSEGK